VEFAQTDQAQVGEIGLAGRVPARQRRERWKVRRDVERNAHEPLLHPVEHRLRVPHSQRAFAENRLAGEREPRSAHALGETNRPVVLRVRAIEKAFASWNAIPPPGAPQRATGSAG
jgi:hypothetical protein